MEKKQTINFKENYNGKLLLDVFGSVRPYDIEKHILSVEYTILLNKVAIGTAKLVAIRTFEFRNIRDVLSYLDIGDQPYVLAGKLKTWYPDTTFFGDEIMAHLVFKFTSRDQKLTEALLIERKYSLLNKFFINELSREGSEFG